MYQDIWFLVCIDGEVSLYTAWTNRALDSGDDNGNQAGSGGTVIAAMGYGKVTAQTIHETLTGEKPEAPAKVEEDEQA